MFGSIAKNYDRTNAVLSFQLHRLWNPRLVKATLLKNEVKSSLEPSVIADLCCGTGAISLPWLETQKIAHEVYLIDFCAEMLTCAEEKAKNTNLEKTHVLNYINADVQAMPLTADSVDYATMAYGIRNVDSPAKCFKEVFRILKTGGSFGILELTEPKNSFLRFGHRLYLKRILPVLGKLFAKNQDAYRYLSQSIQAFAKPAELKILLEEAGFNSVQIQPLSFGIATLIVAKKG